MKKIAILITTTIILSNFLAFGQDYYDVKYVARDTTQPRINVIAYWSKNESHKYRVTTKKLYFKKDTVNNTKIIFDIIYQIKCTDSTDKSYDFEWTFLEDKKNDGKTIDLEDFDPNFLVDYNDLKFRYKTDELGAFEKYYEPEKLDYFFETMQTTIINKMVDTLGSDFAKKMVNVLLYKNALKEDVMEIPVKQFHNILGFGCHLNDTLSYKQKSLNSIGDTLITDGQIFIQSLDSLNEVGIRQIETFDVDQITQTTKKILLKNELSSKNELNELMKDVSYYVDYQNDYYINLNTGVPTYIRISKETGTYDKTKDEYTVYEQENVYIELVE